MKTSERTIYFFIIITIGLWSLVPTIAKLVLKELDSFQVLFFTSLFAILCLSSITLIQNKFKIFRKYSRKQYLIMLLIGALSPFLYYIFLYGSFSIAPVADAQILNYLWPMFIVLFAIVLLKERLTFKKFLGILISFVGCVLVLTKGNIILFDIKYILGYSLAILAAVSYGLFSVLNKKYNYEKVTSMLIFYAITLVLIIPTVSIFSNFVIPSIWELIGLFYLGGIANSLGFVFWLKALQYGDTAKISNLIYLVPFISLIPIYLILKEEIKLMSILGLIFIIFGILIQMKRK